MWKKNQCTLYVWKLVHLVQILTVSSLDRIVSLNDVQLIIKNKWLNQIHHLINYLYYTYYKSLNNYWLNKGCVSLLDFSNAPCFLFLVGFLFVKNNWNSK